MIKSNEARIVKEFDQYYGDEFVIWVETHQSGGSESQDDKSRHVVDRVTEHQNGDESAISIMHLDVCYADFSVIRYDDEIGVCFNFAHRYGHEF
jgi:hypothetical protein